MTLTDPILKFLSEGISKILYGGYNPFIVNEEFYCYEFSGKYHLSLEAEYHRKHKNEQRDIPMM